MDETCQWHCTPDDRADALNAAEQARADGSIHPAVMGLSGTDDSTASPLDAYLRYADTSQ